MKQLTTHDLQRAVNAVEGKAYTAIIDMLCEDELFGSFAFKVIETSEKNGTKFTPDGYTSLMTSFVMIREMYKGEQP